MGAGSPSPADSGAAALHSEEVDLVLVYGGGGGVTLGGFAPWAASQAEIFRMGSVRRRSRARLEHALAVYSQTEKRMGS